MKRKSVVSYCLMLLPLICSMSYAAKNRGEVSLNVAGVLAAEPCDLAEESGNIELDFKTLVQKSFYSTPQSGYLPFAITLKNCDTSIGKSVSFMFKGEESADQPGLLSIKDAAGKRFGLAIGIETLSGDEVKINSGTENYPLNAGDNQFNFRAFIQASPVAIANKSIEYGDFSTSATFELNYL